MLLCSAAYEEGDSGQSELPLSAARTHNSEHAQVLSTFHFLNLSISVQLSSTSKREFYTTREKKMENVKTIILDFQDHVPMHLFVDV